MKEVITVIKTTVLVRTLAQVPTNVSNRLLSYNKGWSHKRKAMFVAIMFSTVSGPSQQSCNNILSIYRNTDSYNIISIQANAVSIYRNIILYYSIIILNDI